MFRCPLHNKAVQAPNLSLIWYDNLFFFHLLKFQTNSFNFFFIFGNDNLFLVNFFYQYIYCCYFFFMLFKLFFEPITRVLIIFFLALFFLY